MGIPKSKQFLTYPTFTGISFSTELVPHVLMAGEITVPGSKMPGNRPLMFRCTLSLPDGSRVISDKFSRKKDAQHDAYHKALDQTPTLEERWGELRKRVEKLFSDKNVKRYSPLREHFKMSLKRTGRRSGQVPIAAIAALDAKVHTLCKLIDPKSETDPVYKVLLICAAARKSSALEFDRDSPLIRRIEPFNSEVKRILSECKHLESGDNEERFRAVFIPCSADVAVYSSKIVVHMGEYYLNVLAQTMRLDDDSKLVISGSIGKEHSALRMYWAFSKHINGLQPNSVSLPALPGQQEGKAKSPADHMDLERHSEKQGTKEKELSSDSQKNVRASLLMGYTVYGDALLASVGFDYQIQNLCFSNYSLNSYYRLLLAKFPQGSYKISRKAILVSDLPVRYSSKLLWQGKKPQDLLTEFCQQHNLPEPAFFAIDKGKIPQVAADPDANLHGSAEVTDPNERVRHSGSFSGAVTVKLLDGSVANFESGSQHRNRHDAIQSCALKALHSCHPWYESCLNGSCVPLIEGSITPCEALENGKSFTWEEISTAEDLFVFDAAWGSSQLQTDQTPPQGVTVTIRYNVRWIRKAFEREKSSEDVIESNSEFMFELGSGAVIEELDTLVRQMCVGKIAVFYASPPLLLFLAACEFLGCPETHAEALTSGWLKYTVQLLKYAEPREESIEKLS